MQYFGYVPQHNIIYKYTYINHEPRLEQIYEFRIEQWLSTGVPWHTTVPRDQLGVSRKISDICD
jgi:hypothetical protein